jgi:medium-chain acyl-[acyl-carrier-protein] hydrolase
MEKSIRDTLINVSKFRITSADTDMETRLRLGSLVNLLIQSAIHSADSLGFGSDGIRQRQLYWVLSRLTVEIYRPLQWYNEVEVETWPKDIERILYLRDYIVRDAQQQVVVRATSGWLAIDLETKRPKKIDDLHAEIFTSLKDKHGIEELPEKLSPITEGDVFEITSRYFDIDPNKHVTSTRYIDWMMDAVPLEVHRSGYPKKLSVNYLKETMPGETIKLIRQQGIDGQFFFEGINVSNNTNAFRGRIEF